MLDHVAVLLASPNTPIVCCYSAAFGFALTATGLSALWWRRTTGR